GMRATNSAARAARAARSAAAEPVLRRCPGPKAEQLPPRENKRYIHCCDKDGVGEKRQQIYERHRIFLSSAGQYGVHTGENNGPHMNGHAYQRSWKWKHKKS